MGQSNDKLYNSILDDARPMHIYANHHKKLKEDPDSKDVFGSEDEYIDYIINYRAFSLSYKPYANTTNHILLGLYYSYNLNKYEKNHHKAIEQFELALATDMPNKVLIYSMLAFRYHDIENNEKHDFYLKLAHDLDPEYTGCIHLQLISDRRNRKYNDVLKKCKILIDHGYYNAYYASAVAGIDQFGKNSKEAVVALSNMSYLMNIDVCKLNNTTHGLNILNFVDEAHVEYLVNMKRKHQAELEKQRIYYENLIEDTYSPNGIKAQELAKKYPNKG